MTTILSIIALGCLAIIAIVFFAIPNDQEGARFMRPFLLICVAIPAGVIVGGLL